MNKRKLLLAFFIFGSLLFFSLTASCQKKEKVKDTFALGDSTFLLDNKPFQNISREMMRGIKDLYPMILLI